MSTDHEYNLLLLEYGHDPATLAQTVTILNDPLPSHVLLGQELFQALYQTGIPWAELYRVDDDGERLGPEPIAPEQVAEHPKEWCVEFNTTNLHARYQVLGIQTYEPYAVQLELRDWSTK